MTVWDPLPETRALEALARQIAVGEVAHAWLLLGPAGSGKRPTAVAMSAALNCPVEPGLGCGECSACLRVLRRRFPDVHHIVPEGPIIPVDVVRETIVPEAARSPFEGRTKVFIIEEAERMNPAAQNALLKTLEEPQPDTVFVLISDDEDEILETIRSRCRIVRLDAIPEARIVELLTRHGVADEAALVAARVAEGDLEYALELVGDGSAGERRRVWLGLPRRLNSPGEAMDAAGEVLATTKTAVGELEDAHKVEVQELAEILERRGSAAARNALAKRHKRELRRREEQVLGEALDTLATFYRDVLLLRRGGAEAITNIDAVSEIERWAAGTVSDAALVAAIARCVETRAALLRNANPSLQIEAVLVELTRLVPAESTVGVGG
ncbi:MAG: DNA polymerase III subunit delta' [Actinomycetota bacterium]|nr:DNA polymerase III subunit delta' [Actinomycetota bacterium]